MDLYVCMEHSQTASLAAKLYFFGNDETRERVCKLLELDPKIVKII